MALPVIFGNLTTAAGSQLDQNFAALGAIIPIPGTLAGTNAITFTALTNTPTVGAYANGMAFVGIAAATNTGSVTFAYDGLTALTVYKDTEVGPVVLGSSEIVQSNAYLFRYDSTLNGGAGGFHLQASIAAVVGARSLSFGNTAAQTTSEVSVSLAGARPGDAVWLGLPTSILAGVVYNAYVPSSNTVNIRAANITAASLTPTGGTFIISTKGVP